MSLVEATLDEVPRSHVLGFFLDFIEIAVVVVPIVAPILLADPSANITAVWLGVMIGLNIQTSFLTPPFGFALFYLRGVAPAVVKTINMYNISLSFKKNWKLI